MAVSYTHLDVYKRQVKYGPLFSSAALAGGYAILSSITESHQVKEQLGEKAVRLSTLISKVGLGIVIINQEHRIIEANERFRCV